METKIESVRIVKPGEGRKLWVLGNHQTHKLTSADTDGKLFIWEERVPPQGGPPPHRHLAEDELFYVLSGEITFFSDAGAVVAGAGTLAQMQKGSLHTFKNTGDTEALMLVMTAPGGFEDYFAAIGTPAADGEVAPPVTPDLVERALAEGPAHQLQFELPA
jgi:quercetin dioxygenase-like cupin family protein